MRDFLPACERPGSESLACTSTFLCRKNSPCRLGRKGIVSKRLGSPYRAGRSPHWVKVKNPNAPAAKGEAEEDGGASLDCLKRDRVECLSRLILYKQGGIPRSIAVLLSQLSHDPMPMLLCCLKIWKVNTVRIVMRVVRGADHKMITRHCRLPVIHNYGRLTYCGRA